MEEASLLLAELTDSHSRLRPSGCSGQSHLRCVWSKQHGNALACDAKELSDLFHGVAVASESGRFSLAKRRPDIVESFDVGRDHGGNTRGWFGFEDLGESLAGIQADKQLIDTGLDSLGSVDVGLGHVVELAKHCDQASCRGPGFSGHTASVTAVDRIVNGYCGNGY